MLAVVVGIASALVYGSADFFGGLASKRMPAVRASAIAAVAGFLVLLPAWAVLGGVWSGAALLWGALSGVASAVGLALLYACLAVGPMSILSPLTAVIAATVPLTVGLIGGEWLAPLGYLALGLALVAVVFVGFVPEKNAVRPRARGILMALGAGVAIGSFLVLLDQTPDDSGVVPLVVNRGTNAAIMLAVVGVLTIVARRRGGARGYDGLRFAIACGVLDVTASLLILTGLRLGELSVMAVLTALYPAGTIVLAAVVVKERVAPVQIVGLALALGACALLALA